MISFVLVIIASMFFSGVVIRTKSIVLGRKGPGIFQPVKDVIRLWKKGAVYSKTTSFIFQIAPSIYFASVLMAIMVVPLGQYKGIISFGGDFVFLLMCWRLENFSASSQHLIPEAVSKAWEPAGKPCFPCLQSLHFLF